MSSSEISNDTIRLRLGAPKLTIDPEILKNVELKPFFEKRFELIPEEILNLLKFSLKTPFFGNPSDILYNLKFFIKGCKLISDSINKRAAGKELYILVPGDSASKVVHYIKTLKLCETCKFIEFPLSKTLFKSVKKDNANIMRYWTELNSIIPNVDLSNILFLDLIFEGETIDEIVREIYINQKIKNGLINSHINTPLIKIIKNELELNKSINKNIRAREFFSLTNPIIKILDKDLDAAYIDLISKLEGTEEFISINKEILERELSIRKSNPILDEKIQDILTMLRIYSFSNIIDIRQYFDSTQEAFTTMNDSSKNNSRCQPQMEIENIYSEPRKSYDPFGCDFFVYMACIYNKYEREIIDLIGASEAKVSLKTISEIKEIIGVSGAGGDVSQKTAFEKLKERLGDTWKKQIDQSSKDYINSLSGGYYGKYIKYKEKYLSLKRNIFIL